MVVRTLGGEGGRGVRTGSLFGAETFAGTVFAFVGAAGGGVRGMTDLNLEGGEGGEERGFEGGEGGEGGVGEGSQGAS